jgi:hypothetical protein
MDNSAIVKLHVEKKSERISQVKFITDDDLKVFIKEVQVEFRNELQETIMLGETRSCERILEIQYMIRKYIIDNQHRINFSENVTLQERSPLSMTSLFGLYMMVVADIEPIKTVVDVLRQVEHNYYVSLDRIVEVDASGLYAVQAVFYGTEIHQKMLCCCSHKCHIDHMGIIKNMITNYHVVIGCDCIKKNHLIDKEVIKQEQQKTNKFLVNKAKQLAVRTQKKIEKDKIKRQELMRIKEQEDEKEAREYEIRKARWNLEEAVKEEWIKQRDAKLEIKRLEEEEAQKKRDDENVIINKRMSLVNEIKRKNEPFYLNVQYKDKDTAKTLGAWWDNDVRKWYIRPNSMNIYSLLEKYHKL